MNKNKTTPGKAVSKKTAKSPAKKSPAKKAAGKTVVKKTAKKAVAKTAKAIKAPVKKEAAKKKPSRMKKVVEKIKTTVSKATAGSSGGFEFNIGWRVGNPKEAAAKDAAIAAGGDPGATKDAAKQA